MADAVVLSKSGILLDMGCGGNKIAPHWLGMDKRRLPGVDLVHDLEVFPYPLADESVLTTFCSHVMEHIKPWLTIDVMNEVWRITKPGGKFVINVPYANSPGYWQDPTHCNEFIAETFIYFDPYPMMLGWNEEKQIQGEPNVWFATYLPKPWKIIHTTYDFNANLEVVLVKRADILREAPAELPKREEPNHGKL